MRPTERGRDGFAESMTDLMAGVAAIFLLIAVVFILIAAKRHETTGIIIADEIDRLRQTLQGDEELKDVVEVAKGSAGNDPFSLMTVFKRDKLRFESARCDLAPQQLSMIDKVAPRVLKHVCDFVEKLEREKEA